MSERNQILLLVAVTAIIAIAGTQVATMISGSEGEAVVSQYTAKLYADGRLEETFTYKINANDKHFLYRYWEAPLSLDELNYAHIQLLDIDVPAGTYWYVMDHEGTLHTSDTIDIYSYNDIHMLAYWNEAGAYNPNYYAPGEYTVKYYYQVRPPLEYDDEYSHLNLKLASDHIVYQNVRVEIEDVGYYETVYPHPPTLKKSSDKNWIIYTGSSAENELLEFEFLMSPEALSHIDGFPSQVDDIKAQTVNANNAYRFEYIIATGFFWFNKLATFLAPVGLYLLWQRFGMEKEYVVPEFLSTIPNKTRRPWIVNLVFKRDATDFDDDGFYATLLDLHEKGKIRIDVEDEKAVIHLISETGLDRYEIDVMSFLYKMARNDVVRTEYMTEMVEEAQHDTFVESKVLDLMRRYEKLVAGTDNGVAGEFTTNGRKRLVWPILLAVVLTFAPIFSLIFYDNAVNLFLGAAGYGAVVLVQCIIAVIFPSTLFGYWKNDNYREKLEWDAFKNHLTDFSRLQQYGPEDMNMWGSWLVYGTAMGVGDKVAKAMQNLEIDYPTMHLVLSLIHI